MSIPSRLTRVRFTLALLASCVLYAGPSASAPSVTRNDEVPMYGGPEVFQRTRNEDPALKQADDKLIADASAHYGSREQAARAWIQQGYTYYGHDQLGMATRRFNQAWLLDPSNPEVYAGFAAILHDQSKMCEAMRMMDKVLSMSSPPKPGVLPDAARIIALCATSDAGLSADDKAALYQRAENLYRQAERIEPNKGYVYYSWATTEYWRGNYAAAWDRVAKAHAHGAEPNRKFLGMLAAKMPEPQAR
jgi:Tfp pilus assembly protein PilF